MTSKTARTSFVLAGAIAAAVAGVGGLGGQARAAMTYATGFEDFTVGPLSPSISTAQNGWSGGAQGGLTNNDPGDEQVVNTVAHSGVQSWHYARGYNSPGQGTAYTPNLDAGVTNVGDTMTGSVWFKAHTAADDSLLAIETGNIVGDDRAEILAYVDNVAGGLTVRSFAGGTFTPVPIAVGLDASEWHQLTFSLTLTPTDNAVSISVDGGSPVNFDGSLKEYRDNLLAPYSESSRLKFRPRHLDGVAAFNGFYLDDISYSVAAVPEPTTIGVIGLAACGLLARRRRD